MLTSTHKKVYEAIKASTEYGYPILIRDLCDAAGLEYNPNPKHGSICRKLWNIIEELRESKEIDEYPMSDGYRFWLADREDYEEMDDKFTLQIKKLSLRRKALRKKAKQNGQGAVMDSHDEPLPPGQEEFHDSFVEQPKKDERGYKAWIAEIRKQAKSPNADPSMVELPERNPHKKRPESVPCPE